MKANPLLDTFLYLFFGCLFLVCVWVGKSSMEAKAYNRVTGENVTTADAMWLQLRVDCRGVR